MDLEGEIKKLKSQQLRIIFLLEEVISHLDNNQINGLGEKIRLFHLKLKDEKLI